MTGEPTGLDTGNGASPNLRIGGTRKKCRIAARILRNNYECACTIQNISPTGIGILTNCIIQFSVGDKLHVNNMEIGHVDAVVRWAAHPNYGLEFDEAGKAKKVLQQYIQQL